ncbi:MAG TPA: glycosyltransferase 87 family protein [Streptosporangiaceae bacterium]
MSGETGTNDDRSRAADLGMPVIVAIFAVSAAVCCAVAAAGQAGLTDLHVYRMGGAAALHGTSLYGPRYHGLPFTYPPFAAAVFVVLTVLPWAAAATLLTAASAAALPLMLYLALRLPSAAAGGRQTAHRCPPVGSKPQIDALRAAGARPAAAWLSRRDAARLALAAAALAIWLEPVRTTLNYGQVDLLLAAAVLYDLAVPDSARRKGVATGLAAGLKLTPAIFVAYLLLTRRYRAAATAAAVCAATLGIGYAVLPASSARYWGGMFLSPGHISPVSDPQNQSLQGALARTLHTASPAHLWLPLAIVVALAGLMLAARAQRRGDEALGFALCAVTGLLISPISWTHHWVIAVPALLLAATALYRDRTRSRRARRLGLAAIAAPAVIGWARMARVVPGRHWLHLPALGILDSEIYVIAGLLALTLAARPLLARTVLAGTVLAKGAAGIPPGQAAREPDADEVPQLATRRGTR